jgi:hypothetical protein
MHECFDEIAARHGMKCVAEIAGYTVTYENELSRLTVSYDSRRSREVYVLISAIQTHGGPHPPPFDQAEVLGSKNSPDATSVGCVRAEDPPSLRLVLEKLANLTDIWAGKLLDGDAEEFAALAKFREWRSVVYAQDVKSRARIRSRIGVAWEKKDYEDVLDLYRALGLHITDPERQRLAEAERLLGGQAISEGS